MRESFLGLAVLGRRHGLRVPKPPTRETDQPPRRKRSRQPRFNGGEYVRGNLFDCFGGVDHEVTLRSTSAQTQELIAHALMEGQRFSFKTVGRSAEPGETDSWVDVEHNCEMWPQT